MQTAFHFLLTFCRSVGFCYFAFILSKLSYKYLIPFKIFFYFYNFQQKVKDMLMLSWQQGFPQSASERSLTLSLVVPVLHLVKCLLSVLIRARGGDVSSRAMQSFVKVYIRILRFSSRI